MDFILFLERRWHRFEVLWALLIATALSLTFVILDAVGVISGELKTYSPYFYLGPIATSLISIYWWQTHRIPRNLPEKIGFLISLKTEDVRESIAIRRDFGHEVTSLLSSHPIHVMQLGPPHVDRIKDRNTAFEYSNKCLAHFHIFGDVRKRRIEGKEVYALRLEGMIRHAPTTADNQSGLSQEMTEVLPLRVNLPLENDLGGFEFTSVWMAESAKFVIATAALLSNDPFLAIQLLEELNASKKLLEKKLKKSPAGGIKRVLKKLPTRLASAYQMASRVQFTKWRETRDLSDLQLSWEHIQKYNAFEKNTQIFFTVQAIWLFVSKRDISGALKSILTCVTKNIADPTWRFSAAFLEAYRGNEGKALEYYKTAIEFGGKHDLFFEIEEFISWALNEEPDHYQLHFCLGYINYATKGDLISAKNELEMFLKKRINEDFPKFAQNAKNILADIEQQIKEAPLKGSGSQLKGPGSNSSPS